MDDLGCDYFCSGLWILLDAEYHGADIVAEAGVFLLGVGGICGIGLICFVLGFWVGLDFGERRFFVI